MSSRAATDARRPSCGAASRRRHRRRSTSTRGRSTSSGRASTRRRTARGAPPSRSSARSHIGSPARPNCYVTRQAIFAGVGIAGAIAAVLVDPGLYRRYHRAIYIGTIALMVLVLLSAPFTRGSKRWIDLGPFRFQPSEFGKLLFVLARAGFLADR